MFLVRYSQAQFLYPPPQRLAKVEIAGTGATLGELGLDGQQERALKVRDHTLWTPVNARYPEHLPFHLGQELSILPHRFARHQAQDERHHSTHVPGKPCDTFQNHLWFGSYIVVFNCVFFLLWPGDVIYTVSVK